MKKLLHIINLSLIIIFLLAIFSFLPKSVLADGAIIEPDPYSGRWDYSDEDNQQAFINYSNGLQKMIISVGIDKENSNGAVWLFPVPAEPNKVAIDVAKSMPVLKGKDISEKAKLNLDNAKKFLQMTQLYTIPIMPNLSTLSTDTVDVGDYDGIANSLRGGVEQDVVVHEHLEKEGITSEIITAKTASGLYDYLKGKGLKIEAGSIPVFDNYIGKNFSFIASWISSPEKSTFVDKIKNELNYYFLYRYDYPEFLNLISDLKQKYPEFNQAYAYDPVGYLRSRQGAIVMEELAQAIQNDPSIIEDAYDRYEKSANQKGVFVTFPTKEIYFPLLPTSVYGSKTIPVTIRVIGHVTPKVFQDIKSYTKTEYYVDKYASFGSDFKDFYSGQGENIKYTKIEINAPSKFFTDDLWLKARAPVKTYYSTFIAKYPIVITVFLFILSSVLTGLLVGSIFFKDLRKNPLKLGLIGLSNLLTIIGLLITTVLIKTKNTSKNVEPILAKTIQKEYCWERRVATILFLVATPFFVFGLFSLPSLLDSLDTSMRYGYYHFDDYFIPNLIFYILPTAALITGFLIKRIKPEDKNLFKQLKLAGYSSWTFQPKDKLKIVFVPVFSIAFLAISWLIVKFVELIV
ncbi:MAG: hypothetical protein BWY51_00972 [Parcubacteria group bacterium ADurb.Bin316]|nr:MAG: hypothetical protein BWY51_00972 [Parcubacteria group bacterium ADurb.Bin316]